MNTLLQILITFLAIHLFMMGLIKVLNKCPFTIFIPLASIVIIYSYYIVLVEANILNLF